MNIEVQGNGLLVKPTCAFCGYRVPGECVVGAGCPNCHHRLLPVVAPAPVPAPTVVAGAGAEELRAKDAENAELRARIAELEAKAAGEGA